MRKRLFIGFPVVCEQEKLREVFAKVKKDADIQKIHIKWIAVENFHITLKFLGSVEEEKIAGIEQTLTLIISKHFSFDLMIQGMGAFPNLKHPNILWIGAECKKEILNLQKDIEKNMIELGFKPEPREYAPHITIGRLKKIHSLEKVFSPFEKTFLGITKVQSVILYESQLGNGGSIYVPLKEAALHD